MVRKRYEKVLFKVLAFYNFLSHCIYQLDTQNSRRNNDTSNADINNVSIESPTETPSSKRSRQNDTSSKSPEFPLSKRSRRSSES